jgi:pyridoxal phosphate enzyme (YggS family)
MMSAMEIAQNFYAVSERIAETARRCGRNPADIRLVVVTKGHAVEKIQQVVDAGAQILGENYIEEAESKIARLAGQAGLQWHMIGHVQSRKARSVCLLFHYLHSLDSIKLAERIDRFAEESGVRLPVLLECNVSGEETKFGFPAWQEDRWPELIPILEQVAGCSNLDVRGLMTMAPYSPEAEMARPNFQRLRRLRDFLRRSIPQVDWVELSMGMSADYEVAVEEGATIVRIGTAILGSRPVQEEK